MRQARRFRPTAILFIGMLLLFCLLVFALCRNEPPPAADDAEASLTVPVAQASLTVPV